MTGCYDTKKNKNNPNYLPYNLKQTFKQLISYSPDFQHDPERMIELERLNF